MVDLGYLCLTVTFDVHFMGTILLGNKVPVKPFHIETKEGNMAVKVETTIRQGEKIIQGTAEVAQPPTVYVFSS